MRDGPAIPAAADKARATIADKVRFLSDPASYPGHEKRIEVVETHFSWVFLTSTHAYKLKKPAWGIGFDFRSAAGRRRNAVAEIRLNLRLAPKVYLGIVALIQRPNGELRLGGADSPVDWLVQMVRLEADRMLDKRLIEANWRFAELEALAQRLAQFFASAQRITAPPLAHVAHLRNEMHQALSAFSRVGEPKVRCRAQPIVRTLNAFVARHAPLFCRRAREHLIDGHGDLRPEHVYLKGTTQIIDCLEFRADLRRLDPVSEIAFLALECDRLGASPIARQLIRRYRERTGDRPPEALFAFYGALNALVRARLAVEHIAEPGTRTRAEWIDRALAYLTIAAKHCRAL